MTTGALIIAYNNEEIDYVSMAAWSAANIQRHLGIPVALITDRRPADATAFDQIILQDRRQDSSRRHFNDAGSVTWHNTNRMDAYKLSPWDRTLLLDADYVVASNALAPLLAADQDILAYGRAHDVTGRNDFAGLNSFGEFHMPMAWATAVMFRRSAHAELVFQSMTMIREHWRHYTDIYKCAGSIYRNDYALTIALGMANGHDIDYPMIPGSLPTVLPDCALSQQDSDNYRIEYTDSENRRKWLLLQGCDFHAMNKKFLGDIIAQSAA